MIVYMFYLRWTHISDFALTLPEKSILAKQINDSIYVLLKMDSHPISPLRLRFDIT